ncbi:EAL domain-containing protein [Rhodoferax sp. AJA081-3]|uniref:putative bifunctional diguanylate cyclase/phosphodiesterase n=1 Tax=Rhodoferax sp. AJA081-3 TaxID=2752316 RepID=UPI001ADF184B|nr:EAL domain-containing protein [Rhodoferax sp. AJA081-3]QTN27179.1 EAL domain-containing protein [Rhodoferax sp. AJA081-3]
MPDPCPAKKAARQPGARKGSATAALRVSEMRYRRLFETARDGILLLNASTAEIEDANPFLIDLLGYSHTELLGKKLWEVGAFVDVLESQEKFSELQSQGYVRYDDLPLRKKNGAIVPVEFVSNTYDCAGVTVIQCNIRDISARKRSDEKINELAFFDPLTRLPNRTLLLDRLQQAMIVSTRNTTYGCVMFLDLDHFKTLNDTLGHDMGDLLLQQVAQRLTDCVREGDTVARLGGDEFVVVLENLHTQRSDAANQAQDVGEKILASLNRPYRLGDVEHRSTASVGATLFFGAKESSENLLKQADMAMYKTKEIGRNGLQFFDPAMQTAILQRASLEADLRRAISDDQLILHFQPQVVGDGRATGAEVLVHWQHPVHGLMPPGKFIPLAEETGLILPLGQWVLQAACAQLARWAESPKTQHLCLAVNVSAHQFRRPDFVEQVLEALADSGANAQRLKLELTETLLIDDVPSVIEKMFILKAKGVCFSLDDFGTGYSSLSYLKRLPLDELKIDRSFVRDILSDHHDASIAKTIIALVQSLGMNVIAEGVELEAQREFLSAAGCHTYQGFFFCMPLPVTAFERYARRTQ